MKTYEYIRLYFDFGDLKDLNALGSAGWRVVTVSQDPERYRTGNIALLEREPTMDLAEYKKLKETVDNNGRPTLESLQREVTCIKHRQVDCPWCLFDSDRYGDKEVPVAA
jgi:hypothetical protein